MTQLVGEHRPAIIVTDASVLIFFLRIDRKDLFAGHFHAFIATDHVTAEITDRYPDQQQRFAAALAAGAISETRVRPPGRSPTAPAIAATAPRLPPDRG